MQYLKALVIGMGILIIVGFGLLVYGLTGKTSSKQTSAPAPEPAQSQLTGFGEIALTGYEGCRIKRALPDGRRLVLHLTDTADSGALNCQKTVIIDMGTGTIIGTIALKP